MADRNVVAQVNGNTIACKDPDVVGVDDAADRHHFQFDRVFDQSTSTQVLYETTMKAMLGSFLDGINGSPGGRRRPPANADIRPLPGRHDHDVWTDVQREDVHVVGDGGVPGRELAGSSRPARHGRPAHRTVDRLHVVL